MPIISQKELDKLKAKTGVYSQLRNPTFANTLKGMLVTLIESAFREYVSKRRPTKEMEDLEWQRFKKILLNYL